MEVCDDRSVRRSSAIRGSKENQMKSLGESEDISMYDACSIMYSNTKNVSESSTN
jgi:hypothetical protein